MFKHILYTKMEKYLKIPDAEYITNYIYDEIIQIHETGGKYYSYKIPYGMSISIINDVIDRLSAYLSDTDSIELMNGYLIIDWS